VRLSVIVPTYNESHRIAASLHRFYEYLGEQEYDYEIIVVDDASTDNTREIVRNEFPDTILLVDKPNRGKGYAVKRGIEAAKGEIRLFTDADNSTPIEEVEKFWPHFDSGADVVIGSRSLPNSQVEVHQPWYRENMGKIYNLVLRIFGLTSFPDTQCGFKAVSAHAADIIFPRQTVNRFGFDAEILYIAQRHGLRVEQVPIRWINSPQSRVHPLIDSAKMLGEVVRIRLNTWRGIYD